MLDFFQHVSVFVPDPALVLQKKIQLCSMYFNFFFQLFLDGVSTKMHQNNVFTVAKRTLEGQDMVYQSIKFTNNVWALCELKLSPGANVISLAVKSRAVDVAQGVYQAYEAILRN